MKNIFRLSIWLIFLALQSCKNEDMDIIGSNFGYEITFSKDEIILSSEKQVFYIDVIDKKGFLNKYKKDWIYYGIGVAEYEDFFPYEALLNGSSYVPYKDLMFRYFIEENYSDELDLGWISFKKIKTDDISRIMITVEENKSENPRIIGLEISYPQVFKEGKGDYCYYGFLKITQEGKIDTQPYTMKARYKGKIYETIAYNDPNEGIVIENEEFKALIDKLSEMDMVETIIMDDEIVDYFDEEDFNQNPQLASYRTQIEKGMSTDRRNDIFQTRATGFEYMSSSALGYCAVFDDTGFTDTHLVSNLTSLDDSWNIDLMSYYGMNDKVSSVAVAYKGSDPTLTAVMTAWEDSHFNHGDDYRSKHRISFIASYYNPHVSWTNLKNIYCLGTKKNWNDRISSLTFHFGYYGRNLSDY